jgi:hypothetical protein
MGEGNHIGPTSHPGPHAALYSQYSPERTYPISQNHALFSLLIAKILKQHSSLWHEQYLFVDSVAVSGKGSATTGDSTRTVCELGGGQNASGIP